MHLPICPSGHSSTLQTVLYIYSVPNTVAVPEDAGVSTTEPEGEVGEFSPTCHPSITISSHKFRAQMQVLSWKGKCVLRVWNKANDLGRLGTSQPKAPPPGLSRSGPRGSACWWIKQRLWPEVCGRAVCQHRESCPGHAGPRRLLRRL